MKVTILGIDPGMSGGLAVLYEDGELMAVTKMPDNEYEIQDFVDEHCNLTTIAYLERVSAMPKQGVASTFKFGQSYGTLLGVIAANGLRRVLVTPTAWQTELKCRSKGDKNVTKNAARAIFPQVKVTHAIADALLIAKYGQLQQAK